MGFTRYDRLGRPQVDGEGAQFLTFIRLMSAARADAHGFDGPLGDAAQIAIAFKEAGLPFADGMLISVLAAQAIQTGEDPKIVCRDFGLKNP